MQHPHAIGGAMNNKNASADNTRNTNGSNQLLPPSDQPARYRLIYDDICRYCNDMWANISATRGRAVEHAIFSASLLGLYFAFGAAYDSYEIGWLGLTGALALLFTTLPHLRIVIGITKIRESRLNIGHSESPLGGPEKLIITAQETKADALERKSEAIGKMYVSARMYWLTGVTAGAALGVLEWFL